MDDECYLVEIESKNKTCHGRKKLWQLDSPFHCSIIGTCLTLDELRRFCQKLQITMRESLSDYELHRTFVGVAAKSGYAARRLHKYLDDKYRTTISRIAKAQSDTSLVTLWTEAVATGEIAGAYWALSTHPQASEALCDRIYGEVHMLSHLAGATVRVDMMKMTRLKSLTKTLREQVEDVEKKAGQQITDRDEVIKQLQKDLKLAQATTMELNTMRERLVSMETEPLSLRLRKQVEEYAIKLIDERGRAERAEANATEWKQLAMQSGDRHMQLEEKLSQLYAERDAVEATLERLLRPDCNACEGCEECLAGINLSGRCILYVGGRARQCANFRLLVERQNGRFIHHDGGLQDSRLRLKSLLPTVDAVLCPLDCISHDAVKRVKQYCKHHGKQLVFLPRSSLAAFSRGLNELSA